VGGVSHKEGVPILSLLHTTKTICIYCAFLLLYNTSTVGMTFKGCCLYCLLEFHDHGF